MKLSLTNFIVFLRNNWKSEIISVFLPPWCVDRNNSGVRRAVKSSSIALSSPEKNQPHLNLDNFPMKIFKKTRLNNIFGWNQGGILALKTLNLLFL